MGSGVSTLFSCIKPPAADFKDGGATERRGHDLVFEEPLDETLGHSFCYVRSSNRFVSPSQSDRFAVVTPSTSMRFSPSRIVSEETVATSSAASTGFKAISGASVSANNSASQAVFQIDTGSEYGGLERGSAVNLGGFESTSLFSVLPLQPVPRGEEGFFLSGPLERGALSGPIIDPNYGGSSLDNVSSRVPFSAPLGVPYAKTKKRGFSGIKKAIYRNMPEKKKRPWVVPVLNFGNKREKIGKAEKEVGDKPESQIQWAHGKAGEDRVHVVVSEEEGWLFVGIYDGFNGPDAPEFLMGNLYRCIYNELQGLFWEVEEESTREMTNTHIPDEIPPSGAGKSNCSYDDSDIMENDRGKRVRFQSVGSDITRRKRLWELLAEDDSEDGLYLSGSERFAFSVDDAIILGRSQSSASKRWMLLSKLKQGLSKQREEKQFSWKSELEIKGAQVNVSDDSGITGNSFKKVKKVGPVDHNLVLRAISKALELTELEYLDMTDKMRDTNPELALMGSCLLVVLMRDEEVYVMNVGDSRAIVAQFQPNEDLPSSDFQSIKEVTSVASGDIMKLAALQLSTDHSTSIEEEIIRIKNEHPDDSECIVNDRVKGRLKVTRAFGAGFLKMPKYNDSVLAMFRNEYIGTAPYISCTPSLRHHHLSSQDQFLVLSSDGLYQFLTNEEVVSVVQNFMEKFPDGDPAQHLIEEVLTRAAKKAGMDFHELLDIPQGDRRKYHDDVTVMVVSLEGRIWKSSGKYL